MTIDCVYKNLNYDLSCHEHAYGDGVSIKMRGPDLSLRNYARPDVEQPLLNILVTKLYGILLGEVVSALPREIVSWDTRMKYCVSRCVFG